MCWIAVLEKHNHQNTLIISKGPVSFFQKKQKEGVALYDTPDIKFKEIKAQRK